jgi:hypothetical protein
LPTVKIPPTYNCIATEYGTVETNGDEGLELPICKFIDPEGTPTRRASGPFRIEITVPRFACTSNNAEENGNPRPRRTTSPVAERKLDGRIVTVPPVAP